MTATHKDMANAIRALAMDAVQKANSGHPGMPMGMADIAEVLWRDVLKYNPCNPFWFDRDRFVLSNGHASMLLYSAPLWVAAVGWLGWGERPDRREVLPLALTLLGVIVVALSTGSPASGHRLDGGLDGGAVGWGLLSGITYALYYLMGRPLFAHNAPSRALAWVLAIGALALAPFVTFAAISPRAWAALGFLAAFCTFGAYLAYAHGIRRLSPSQAATVATLEPVVALGAAYGVWGERLAPAGIAGAGLVIAGILGSARLASRTAPGENPP